MAIDRVEIRASSKTYENGVVSWRLCSKDKCATISGMLLQSKVCKLLMLWTRNLKKKYPSKISLKIFFSLFDLYLKNLIDIWQWYNCACSGYQAEGPLARGKPTYPKEQQQCVMVKLLSCRARSLGFVPGSCHWDFNSMISPTFNTHYKVM